MLSFNHLDYHLDYFLLNYKVLRLMIQRDFLSFKLTRQESDLGKGK